MSKSVALLLVLMCLLSLCLATCDSAAEQTVEEEAKVVLRDLVGLNVTDSNIKSISVSSADFYGLAQESVDIRLVSGLRPLVRFVNNTLRQIFIAEIDRPSSSPPASQVTDSAKAFLERVQTYTGDPFYGELRSTLENVTGEESMQRIVGNVELKVLNTDNFIDYQWTYIDENGTRAPSKNICLNYDRGQFYIFLNNWPFYTIAAEPEISSDEAIASALKALRNFSYNMSGGKSVSKFRIATSGDPVRATIFYSNDPDPSLTRDGNPLMLYPLWSVFMGFDRYYPGYVTGAQATGWADTGEVTRLGETFLVFPSVTPEEIEDDVAPSMKVSVLESETHNATDVFLSYEASEPVSWVDYSLDGQANVTLTGNTTVTGNFTLTGLSEGSHNLKVYAADAYGSTANIGASETIYFNIVKPETALTQLAIAASGASVAIVGIGLLVYFKKYRKMTGNQA